MLHTSEKDISETIELPGYDVAGEVLRAFLGYSTEKYDVSLVDVTNMSIVRL